MAGVSKSWTRRLLKCRRRSQQRKSRWKLVECGLPFDCWMLACSFLTGMFVFCFRELHASNLLVQLFLFLSAISGIPPKLNGDIFCAYLREFLVSDLWSLTSFRPDSSGQARITSFAAQSNAQTFDFQVSITSKYLRHCCNCIGQAGDISYIPASFGEFRFSAVREPW